MNADAIKARLKQIQTKNTKLDSIWKPAEGKNLIRIVPNKFNREFPFIELYFHYGFGQKSYLSPITYNRPDPIVKFSEKLKRSGSKDDYRLSKKLDPKMRTYVPIIERGKEHEGVRYWGFGKLVYEQLLKLMDDPDYGDISDAKNGRDIMVEFVSAKDSGKDFPTTSILVKPNVSVLTDNRDTMKIIADSQKELSEVFKEPTYDELEQILNEYLDSTSETDVMPEKSNQSNSKDSSHDEKPSYTTTSSKSNDNPISKEDLSDEFDQLLNS